MGLSVFYYFKWAFITNLSLKLLLYLFIFTTQICGEISFFNKIKYSESFLLVYYINYLKQWSNILNTGSFQFFSLTNFSKQFTILFFWDYSHLKFNTVLWFNSFIMPLCHTTFLLQKFNFISIWFLIFFFLIFLWWFLL